jgi:hypothetical protein
MKQQKHHKNSMEDIMKNTFKKLGLIIATAAVVFIGTANAYATQGGFNFPNTQDAASYQRFLDIETGN